MATFLYRLGRFAFRRRHLVALFWVALLALAGAGAAGAPAAGSSSFSIPGTEAQKAFDLLEERFDDPRLQVVRGSAEHLREHLGEEQADVLVCALPFTSLEPGLRRRILDGVVELGGGVDAHALAFAAAARPARRPKTTHSSNELPIMRLRPCVPPAISPQA